MISPEICIFVVTHYCHLISPLGDLHDLLLVRIVTKVVLGEDQLAIDFNLKHIWKNSE